MYWYVVLIPQKMQTPLDNKKTVAFIDSNIEIARMQKLLCLPHTIARIDFQQIGNEQTWTKKWHDDLITFDRLHAHKKKKKRRIKMTSKVVY